MRLPAVVVPEVLAVAAALALLLSARKDRRLLPAVATRRAVVLSEVLAVATEHVLLQLRSLRW